MSKTAAEGAGASYPLSGRQSHADICRVIEHVVLPDVAKCYVPSGAERPTLVIRIEPKLLLWWFE